LGWFGRENRVAAQVEYQSVLPRRWNSVLDICWKLKWAKNELKMIQRKVFPINPNVFWMHNSGKKVSQEILLKTLA